LLTVSLNGRRVETKQEEGKRRGIPESVSVEEPFEWEDEQGFIEIERGEQEAIYNNILIQQLGKIGTTTTTNKTVTESKS